MGVLALAQTGVSDTSTSLNVASLASTVDTALEAMTSIGAVTVTRTVAGGPAITFTVVYTEDLGNIAELTCSYGSGSCTPSTVEDVRYHEAWCCCDICGFFP